MIVNKFHSFGINGLFNEKDMKLIYIELYNDINFYNQYFPKIKILIYMNTIDIFRRPFFFHIGNLSTHTTYFSVLISLLVLIPLLTLSIILMIGAVNRTTPHINVQEMEVLKHPLIDLNHENYKLAITFQTRKGSFLNKSQIPSFFDVRVGERTFVNGPDGIFMVKERGIEVENCRKSEYDGFEEYYDLNLREAICLKNHNFTLQGYWDESKISYIFIELRMCDNKKSKVICKSREEILDIFKGGHFYLHTESQNVNSLNYQTPQILTMKAIQFLIDPNTHSEVSLYFQKMTLSTYDGLIYNGEAKIEDYYKQTYYTINSMSISENETMFWSCSLLSSTKLLTIERYYSTLIEVVGIVGGISKFLILLGFVVTVRYNGIVLAWRMVRESFNCEMKIPSKKKKKSNPYLNIPFQLKIKKSKKPKTKKSKKSKKMSENCLSSCLSPNTNTRELKAFDSPSNKILSEISKNLSPPNSKMNFYSHNSNDFGFNVESPIPLKYPPNKIEKIEIPIKLNIPIIKEEENQSNKSKNVEIPIPLNIPIIKEVEKQVPIELEMINIQIEEENSKKSMEIPISEIKEEEREKEKDEIFSKNENYEREKEFEGKNQIRKSEIREWEVSQVKEDSLEEVMELNLNTCELFMISFLPSLFLPNSLKNKLNYLQEGQSYLKRYTDIYQMIKRFQEMENLKQVLLNNKQISMLNKISKPSIVNNIGFFRKNEDQKADEFSKEFEETLISKKLLIHK